MKPQANQELNWSRDDIFIIGVNKSVERIEIIESMVYGEPMRVYEYLAALSALYSKTHKYIKITTIPKKLKAIREGLYDKKFMSDMKDNKNKSKVEPHFIKLFDGLVDIYREMTGCYTELGIFAKINVEDQTPGALRGR